MDWMFMFQQNSYTETLAFEVKKEVRPLWSGEHERATGHGISAIIKETLECSLAPSAM